jgi:hypothetical protein
MRIKRLYGFPCGDLETDKREHPLIRNEPIYTPDYSHADRAHIWAHKTLDLLAKCWQVLELNHGNVCASNGQQTFPSTGGYAAILRLSPDMVPKLFSATTVVRLIAHLFRFELMHFLVA